MPRTKNTPACGRTNPRRKGPPPAGRARTGLAAEPVVVGLGQDEPEEGQGEQGVRDELGGQPRGPGHQGPRDGEFGSASACTWPVMTAAISAMGRSSRPQPRARMCPRRPAGRGLAFFISRTRANAMLPSSSSDTRYANSSPQAPLAAGALYPGEPPGPAMGLRPGSGVGLSPLPGEAGEPAQGLGQHLGAACRRRSGRGRGPLGVVVEDGGRDGDHARAVGRFRQNSTPSWKPRRLISAVTK
jgi:hypothetical protein